MGQQQLAQGAAWPAAARQLGVEIGEAARHRRAAGAAELMAEPERRMQGLGRAPCFCSLRAPGPGSIRSRPGNRFAGTGRCQRQRHDRKSRIGIHRKYCTFIQYRLQDRPSISLRLVETIASGNRLIAFGNRPADNVGVTEPALSPTAAVRRFNRFYTRRIGVLHEKLADTRFSLAESRLLWELAHRGRTTAAELARDLDLDPGYVSRLLRTLKEAKLIRSERAAEDARHLHLSLTAAGRRAFAPLDRRSEADVSALLAAVPDHTRHRLLGAMNEIETLLGEHPTATAPWLLRSPRPGDIGWVVARHGRVYADEYGWDLRFEALVARIAADFIDRFDAAREACWIAERDGANVGCVFLVQAREEASGTVVEGTAQLRLLLVEPSTRGLGIGARLVDECERFARAQGYRRIVLWTNSVLSAARAIYAKAGYRLLASEPHESFGRPLVGETWALALD